MAKKGVSKLKFEENLLRKGEVSLALDDYEDIFSDFDPRPYSHRALSTDFLDEARRATRELGEEGIELNFLIPASKRNIEKEKLIKTRLNEHFRKHKEILAKENKKIFGQGCIFLFIGLIFMIVASYILFYSFVHNFWMQLVIVLLEPGGWFLFWEGLDLIIFETKKMRPDLSFYRKMEKTAVRFSHY